MASKRRHANTSARIPQLVASWEPSCRCGWVGPLQRSRDAARLCWRTHQWWAQASLALRLRKRREAVQRERTAQSQ